MKHTLKQRIVGQKPVNKWYQSLGSRPWERPTTGFQTGKKLLRETPKRIYNWNSRRKSISPKGKEMLVKKVLENEAYNTTKKKEETAGHGKQVTKSKRDKKARCYICRERGHTYWNCDDKKKLASIELQQEEQTMEQKTAEGVR